MSVSPRHAAPPSRRTRATAPAALLGAVTAALVGLATVPDPAGTRLAAQQLTPVEPLLPPEIRVLPPNLELARHQVSADTVVQAALDQAAREQTQRVAAEAEARVTAEAARAPTDRQPGAAPKALASARLCPVPSASFTDTWGASRSGGRVHQGTDMMARSGAPIHAVRSGTVQTSSGSLGGITITLRADDGDEFYYAHNSTNLVRSGQRVSAGDLIARVGSSGNATASAPHLHFERHPGGGRAVNPYTFLRELC